MAEKSVDKSFVERHPSVMDNDDSSDDNEESDLPQDDDRRNNIPSRHSEMQIGRGAQFAIPKLDGDSEHIKLVFLLYCEPEKIVELIVKDDTDRKSEIRMKSCTGSIYSASILLSLSLLINGKYSYGYRRRTQPVDGSEDTETETEDNIRSLNEFSKGEPIRDYWGVFDILDGIPRAGFKAHCLHIFMEFSDERISEIMHDLDLLIKNLIKHSQCRYPLSDSDIKYLIKSIMSISIEKHKSIFIVLLVLLSSIQFNQLQLLNKHHAGMIVKNVCDSGKNVTCMPRCYQTQMPKVLFDICEIVHESEMSISLLIVKTFPFLDASSTKSLMDLLDGFTRPLIRRDSMGNIMPDISHIVKKLLGNNPLRVESQTLLDAIIKQLEFRELQELCRSIPNNELITEMFVSSCKTRIRDAIYFKQLCEFCKSVDQSFHDKLQDPVYNKLLDFIRRDEFSHSSGNFKEISYFCHIFYGNRIPNRMIELLVLYSDNKEKYLFQLLNHLVFEGEAAYCIKTVEVLMGKKIAVFKDNIEMNEQVYSWMEEIFLLPTFLEANCASLVQNIFETMATFSFFDILTMVLLQHNRTKLFENHVSRLLHTKKPRQVKMEDLQKYVLRRVTKKFDGAVLLLDRFRAEILVFLLDMMGLHFTKMRSESVQVVQVILADVEFWKTVARGKVLDMVRNHCVYKIVSSSFGRLLDDVKENKFDYNFAVEMSDAAKRENLVQLMKHFTTGDIDELRRELENACKRMFAITKILKDNIEIVEGVENMLPDDYLDYCPKLTYILESLKEQLLTLESNQHTLDKHLDSKILSTSKKIKENYDPVAAALASELFWKINENEREQLSTLATQEDNFVVVETFLKKLETTFLAKYRKDIDHILRSDSLPLREIKGLITGRNIDKEIAIMLQYSRGTDVSERKTVLRNFFKFEENSKKLTLLFSTATILIDESILPNRKNKALRKVKKIQKMINEEDGDLMDMDKDLQIIERIASRITDDIEEVLKLVQISTELLQFLQEINVDDIHYMADSLEEYSEEIVRKSTVISLMEVEKCFRSLLQKNWNDDDESADMILLNTILVQNPNLKEFAGRLDECIANTFSLKDLHKKHESKSARTGDIINNILSYGTINFELIDYRYHWWVSMMDYSKTPREKKKTRHSPDVACYRFNESELTDLQIRARLRCKINEEKKIKNVKDNFETFFGIVATGFGVVETLVQLQEIGHYKYIKYRKQQGCDLHELKSLLDSMKKDYSEWKEEIDKVRKKYICLNFVHSAQLTSLFEYFAQGKLNQDAKSILLYVKPTNSAVPNTEEIKCDSYKLILKHIAKHIQRMETCPPIADIQLRTRQNISRNLNTQMRKRNVVVAKLKEKSEQGFNVMFAIYMERSELFPQANQVIICSHETTWLDVELLLKRCWCRSQAEDEIYCIVNADLLCDKILQKLSQEIKTLSTGNNNTLAIIFRGNELHPFFERHQDDIQQVDPLSIPEMKMCIENTWSSVSLVTSTLAGLGKTEHIREKAIGNTDLEQTQRLHISSVLNKTLVIKRLQKLNISEKTLIHIDVGMIDKPEDLDQFLFELIVLRYIRSGHHSVFLRTQHIAIEVANTINNTLLEKLKLLANFKTVCLRWEGYNNFIVSQEINSPVQIVCRYLYELKRNSIDKIDLVFDENNENVLKTLPEGLCRKILSEYFQPDIGMSYTKIQVFMAVFSSQLKKITESKYFHSKHIVEIHGADSQCVPRVRSSMVELLLEISREFSCRSVESSNKQSSAQTMCNTVKYDEETNDDKEASDYDGDCYDDNDDDGHSKDIIRWEDINHIFVMFHQDGQTLSLLSKKFRSCEPEYLTQIRNFIDFQIKSYAVPLEKKKQSELRDILRMIACKPEMSKENFEIALENYVLTPDNILKFTLILLRVRANIPVVLLGDTGCGKTSLIKVLAKICDVHFETLNIHAGITEEQILDSILKVNEEANINLSKDIWLFIDEINTNENVGLLSDVLCHHVCLEHVLAPNLSIMAACNPYRFHRVKRWNKNVGLHRSYSTFNKMSHLVYHVHPLPESLLTLVWDFGTLGQKDEKKYINEMLKVSDMNTTELELFTEAVVKSQKFVRESEHTEYSVSLRDVERCRDLRKWFTEIYFTKKYNKSERRIKEAIVFTLNLCYRIRFQSNETRGKYVKELEKIPNFDIDFEAIVRKEQEDIVTRMQMSPEIAKTKTLSENIFTMMICALNYIPLFVVGKPGYSKTLSVQILRSNLRGDDSRDEFFKQLPCLFCVTYLGTKSSTSESIGKAFQKAKHYQEQHKNVQALLILDEIGQAESSGYNPLKILHSLLEGKGVHADVAVIGISNWALDAAKMNRAIHLARPEMDEEELGEIGGSIYKSTASKHRKTNGDPPKWIQKLASAYREYTMHQKSPDFHGLRDYFYLMKHISEKVGRKLRNSDHQIIATGILRNFSGLLPMDSTVSRYFQRHIGLSTDERQDSVLERIRANINDKSSRHLMLISQGDASLATVIKILEELNRKYVHLFGSTLPSDQSKNYDHGVLSKIILGMEDGSVVVLKNLHNIYGNLYDMLNQSYCVVGGKRHCRVALSADYFPMCSVHDDFKCIIIVDRVHLFKTDIPLLNRFEKQNISLEEHLTDTNQKALCILEENLSMMLEFGKDKRIHQRKLMPIQGKESLSSLISHAADVYTVLTEPFQIQEMCILGYLPALFNPEIMIILKQSKLGKEETSLVEEMQKTFWKRRVHNGLNYFLNKRKHKNLLVLALTHSSVNINIEKCFPNENIKIVKMSSVVSEQILRNTLEDFEKDILLIQFPAEIPAENITFVKNMVETENRYKDTKRQIVLLVHINRYSDQKLLNRVEFSGKWQFITIDSVLTPFKPLSQIVGKSIVQVLEHMENDFLTKETLYWAITRIHYVNNDVDTEKGMDRIEHILEKLENVKHHLWQCIIDWLEHEENAHNVSDQWLLELAKNTCIINRSVGSFIGLVENFLIDCVRNPLAVLIYQLESKNALQYLVQMHIADMKFKTDLWGVFLNQENILHVDTYVKPSGPGCFQIQNENTNYKIPFGKYIIEKVECFKEEFIAGFQFTDMDQCKVHQYRLVSKLRNGIWEFKRLKYNGFVKDYLCDFITFISSAPLSSLPLDTRMKLLPWVIDIFTLEKPRNTLKFIANLHTTFWMHSATINGLLKLLQLTHIVGIGDIQQIIDCVDKSFDDGSDNDVGDYPKLHKLTHILCRDIFPSSRGRGLIDDDLRSWQQAAYALRFVSENLNDDQSCFASLNMFLELSTTVEEGSCFTFDALKQLGDTMTYKESIIDLNDVRVRMKLIDITRGIKNKDLFDFIHTCYFTKCISLINDSTNLTSVLENIKNIPDGKNLASSMRFLLHDKLFEEVDIAELTTSYRDIGSIKQFITDNRVLKSLQDVLCNCSNKSTLALILCDILEQIHYFRNETYDRDLSSGTLSLVGTIAKTLEQFEYLHDPNENTVPKLLISAFVKQFLSLFVDVMNVGRHNVNRTIDCVNRVLGRRSSWEELSEIQLYFLRRLEAGNGILCLEAKCMESKYRVIDVCRGVEIEPGTHDLVLEGSVERLCGFERYGYCKSLISISSRKLESGHKLHKSAVLAYALSNFYMKQCFGDIDHNAAIHVSNLLPEEKYEFERKLLKVLTLQDKTRLHLYQLSIEKSSPCDIYLASFAMFFFCMLSENREGLWMKMVKDPNVILVYCQNKMLGEINTEVLFSNCQCGHRFTCQKTTEHITCPICSKLRKQNEPKVTCPLPTKQKFADNILSLLCCSEDLLFVSPITKRILKLLIYLCISCYSGLNPDSEQKVAALLNLRKDDALCKLEQEIRGIWESLTQGLAVGHCELYHLLTLVLSTGREKMLSVWSNEHADHQRIFDIQTVIHTVIKENRFVISDATFLENHKELEENEVSRIKSLLNEDCITERNGIPYFRKTSNSNIESLRTELWLSGRKDTFPFLDLVLEMKSDLDLLKHIDPLLKWHLTTLNLFNYKIQKSDRYLTFDKFVMKQTAGIKSRIEKELKQDEFVDDWYQLVHCLNSRFNFDINLKRLSGSSKVFEILNLDTDSQIVKALDMLISVQNRFLDDAMTICISNMSCKSLGCMNQDKGTALVPISPLTNVESDFIIKFDISEYLRYSQNDTKRGRGRHMEYNYRRIEFELAREILTGKAHLLPAYQSLPRFQFKDDVFKNTMHLIRKIRSSVKQEVMPFTVSEDIRGNMVDREELLSLSEVLLAHMNHVGTHRKPSLTLDKYMEEWKNVFGMKDYENLIPNKGFMKLQLCHVEAFYKLMEELNGEKILEYKQEIYGDAFTENLKKDIHEVDTRFLEVFLKAMRTFAFRRLRDDIDVDREMRLRDESCLGNPEFWPDNTLRGGKLHVKDKSEHFEDVLDADFRIKHIWSIHQEIKNIIKGADVKMDQSVGAITVKYRNPNSSTGGKKSMKKWKV